MKLDLFVKINNITEFHRIILRMENGLLEFKEKFPDSEKIPDAEHNVKQLKKLVIWMEQLWNEAEKEQRHCLNLTLEKHYLMNSLNSLREENEKLKKIIENE